MEFIQLLQALHVDVNQTLERFSNNQQLLQSFVIKFTKEPTYFRLESSFYAKDYEAAQEHVHTLKGIAANLGFECLYEYCVVMLKDLRGTRASLCDEFCKIKNEYEFIVAKIAEFVK